MEIIIRCLDRLVVWVVIRMLGKDRDPTGEVTSTEAKTTRMEQETRMVVPTGME